MTASNYPVCHLTYALAALALAYWASPTANALLLVEGEAGELQVEVRNLEPALALDVILTYSGHVPTAGQVALGTSIARQAWTVQVFET